MKSALGSTIAALVVAVLLVVALSPRSGIIVLGGRSWALYRADTSEMGKVSERYYAERGRVSGLTAAVERATARELAPTSAPPGLTVRPGAGVPSTVVDVITTTARAEVAALGVDQARHPVVVMAVAEFDGPQARYSRTIVLPTSPEGPCTVIVQIPNKQFKSFNISAVDRILGTCAFHARYGTPGAATNTWLRETRVARAAYLTPPASRGEDTTMVRSGRWPFSTALPLRGCRAGRPALCDLLLSPNPASNDTLDYAYYFEGSGTEARRSRRFHSDVVVFGATELGSDRANVLAGLLAGMARSIGPERFGSLWRGDGPIAGFERSEGRPASAWAAEFLSTRVHAEDVGAGITLGIAVLTALLATGIAVLAIRITPRQMD